MIEGVRPIDKTETAKMVKLTLLQARKLPTSAVHCYLNTNDQGGPGRMAKRWFNWYAKPTDVLACPGVTSAMVIAAAKVLRFGVTDRAGVTHAINGPCDHRFVGTNRMIDCMTCLVVEARRG
jgi:hypothetical protein